MDSINNSPFEFSWHSWSWLSHVLRKHFCRLHRSSVGEDSITSINVCSWELHNLNLLRSFSEAKPHDFVLLSHLKFVFQWSNMPLMDNKIMFYITPVKPPRVNEEGGRLNINTDRSNFDPSNLLFFILCNTNLAIVKLSFK